MPAQAPYRRPYCRRRLRTGGVDMGRRTPKPAPPVMAHPTATASRIVPAHALRNQTISSRSGGAQSVARRTPCRPMAALADTAGNSDGEAICTLVTSYFARPRRVGKVEYRRRCRRQSNWRSKRFSKCGGRTRRRTDRHGRLRNGRKRRRPSSSSAAPNLTVNRKEDLYADPQKH